MSMRDWSLKQGDPLYLTLAADARFCTPDYTNDHIWELEFGTGEPRALALHTTYGLRARSMRIFVRFNEGGERVSDPAEFASPPRLRRFYPNFAAVEYAPLENLGVNAEYWIPDSHAVAGRLTLVNRSNTPRRIGLEICAVLAALDGRSLTPIQQQMVNVLAGQTSGITPVVFMTGGPKHGPGPHPSLILELDFGPGAQRVISFAQTALDNLAASFEAARHAAAQPWEAQRTRIELQNEAHVLDIHTGDPEWDAALAFSQKAALGLFMQAKAQLPRPSFVQARQPDHGFSHRDDGSDYPPLWNGQSVLESYYLSTLLPGAPELTKGLIQNYLAVQSVAGEVDNKPGLGGQRGKLLAAPLLASLAWNTLGRVEDKSFLAEVFPKLLDFYRAWFTPEHDRDRNGVPEWDHILQTGFEENPLFDVWHAWSQGLDISLVHSPALAAMLVREADSLIKMAIQLNQSAKGQMSNKDDQSAEYDEEIAWLEACIERLKSAVETGWIEQTGLYSYQDRETGRTQAGRTVARLNGSGELRPEIEFPQPVRLLVEVLTENPAAARPEIELSEATARGESESLYGQRFQWRAGGLVATSRRIYRQLGKVNVRGVAKGERVLIKTVNTTSQDLTLALPLWAGIPDSKKATRIIQVLMDPERFGCPYGFPSLPRAGDPSSTTTHPALRGESAARATAEAEVIAMSVHLPWQHLIGEGLLAYGAQKEAVLLITRVMKAVIQNLKSSHAFHQRYHARRGTGMGERNALQGFAPLGLFLQTLGVSIHAATRVLLEGRNPFPWPVTINYKGLTVTRGLDRTLITFPNGKNVIVEDPAACVVTM